MEEDIGKKTQRFVDALDDTIPKQLPPTAKLKPEAASPGEHKRDSDRGLALRRMLHLMAALVALSVLSSELVEPVVGHLSGETALGPLQAVMVAIKLGLFAALVWAWSEFARHFPQ